MSVINEKSNFTFEFQPVTKLFEEQVRLHPDKCAVVTSKESFTYSELNERANKVANTLIEKGVLAITAGKNAGRLLPPLTISREEMDEALTIMKEVF